MTKRATLALALGIASAAYAQEAAAPRFHFEGETMALAISADGRWLAGAMNDSVRLWDLKAGREAEVEGLPKGTAITFSADGKTLVASDSDGNVTLFDLEARAARPGAALKRIGVPTAALSADGKTLLVAGAGVQVWPVGAPTAPPAFAVLKDEMPRAAFSTDLKTVARWGDAAGVTLWDVASGRKLHTLKTAAEYRSVVFSTSGLVAVATAPGGTLTLFDAAKGTQVRSLSSRDPVTSLAFSPDGKWLAAGGFNDVRIFDVAGGTVAATVPYKSTVNAVAFSADGKLLAVAGGLGVDVWDVPIL